MDSLDLLKSLTAGVNNKVSSNSEESEGLSYRVNTSLRGKKKLSSLEEKKSEPFDSIEVVEEVFEEEVIGEEVDEIIEEVYEEEIIEEEFIEEVIGEEIESIEISEIKEVYKEESSSVIEDKINVGETEESINGHKSEEKTINISNEKPEKKKIDRGGNPFKRGPRKKKSKVETVVEEVQEIKEEDNIKDDLELVEEHNEECIEEVVSTYDEVEEMLFDSVLEELKEEYEEDNLKDEIEENESTIEDNDVEDLEAIEDEVENNSEDEPIVFEEPKKNLEDKKNKISKFEEPILFGEDVDFSFESMQTEDSNTEEDSEPINEVDDKFKNCKYHLGMDIEEFLRENPNYREAMYVEHFYNKDLLDEYLTKGIILFRKGSYRL